MTKSILVGLLFISLYCGYAQQQIVVTVSPTTNVSINGHLDLDRTKYFNLSSAADQISRIKDTAIEDYLFKNLGATMGRQLSMVKSERDWSNAVREDANRPGYLDIDYYISRKNPNDAGLDAYKTLWGDRQGLATHDSHDAYPDFMEQWGVDESDKFPVNTDASAEMVAYMLKHRYTDFQRPTYFELVNEPH